MMLELTRNHLFKVVKDIAKDFSGVVIFLAIIFKSLDLKIWMVALLVFSAILYIVYSIISWRNNSFCIKDGVLLVQSGIIQKSKKEINLEKITTLDTKTNEIYKLFGLYTLRINTGAINALNESEFEFLLNSNTIDKIKGIINNKEEKEEKLPQDDIKEKQIEENCEKSYNINAKDILIYTLTKSKIYFIIGLGCIFGKIENILDLNEIGTYVEGYGQKVFDFTSQVYKESIPFIILAILIFLVFIYMLATIICFFINLNKLYKFRLDIYSDKLEIGYGFFKKSSYKFEFNKINYIETKQSLIGQFLGVYNIGINVVGYNEHGIGRSILYPIANEKLKNKILEALIGEIGTNRKIDYPSENVVGMFIIKKCFICIIICFIAFYFISIGIFIKVILILLLLAIQIALGYNEYKNTSIAIDKDRVFLGSGVLRKCVSIVPNVKIESIGYKQNIFQKRKKVCTYVIDVASENVGDKITVKNLGKEHIEKLENKVVI